MSLSHGPHAAGSIISGGIYGRIYRLAMRRYHADNVDLLRSGAWIAEPIYTYAEAFCEGLAVLKTPMGTYGMIDTEGNVVLPFAYKYISSSSDGLVACYSSENGWEMMRKMTK